MLLLIPACASNEHTNGLNIYGQWEIVWVYEEMATSGQIQFYEDGRASIITSTSPNDLLPPGSHQVDYHWSSSNEALTLQRLDNNLELKYEIISASDHSIALSYADEIQITLLKIR